MSATRKCSPKRSLKKRNHSGRGIISVSVAHGRERPIERNGGCGPDTGEFVGNQSLKSPSFNEAWHRATYDVNKHLTENLGRGFTIKIGDGFTKPAIGTGAIINPRKRGLTPNTRANPRGDMCRSTPAILSLAADANCAFVAAVFRCWLRCRVSHIPQSSL